MAPHAPTAPRPLSRGMQRLLVAAAVLDLLAGTQAFMLPDHAAVFFAWPIAAPLSAAYVGASFWAAGVLIFWASRQTHWVRARVTIPAIAVVVGTLLAATLRHLELFSSPLGLVWIEVYVLVGPVAVVLLALQLGVPGTDPHSGRTLPGWLRGGLAVQAGAMLATGGLLFLAPGTAADVWPWPLTELTSMAIGGWMLGVAVTAVYLVWHDDREDIAGALLADVVLGGCLLLALVMHPGQLDAADPALWAYAAGCLAVLGLGLAGVRLAHRDGAYTVTRAPGGIPVELVAATPAPALNGTPGSSGATARRPGEPPANVRAMADAREVATRYFDALTRRDLDAAAACWAPGGVDHIVGQADAQGPDGVRAYFGELFAAVPDFALRVETTIAEGDHAAVRWNATGTFAGDASYQGIAPTGGPIAIAGLDLLEVRDGLIVHNDGFPDGMGFARQIGMLPAQGSTAEARVLRAFNAKSRAARRLAGGPAEPIAEGVWRVRGGVPREMNVYLIEDVGGGVTVFDAGVRSMVAALASAGSALGGINRVVLGHGHPDHRGAAPGLGAPVYCHADDRADAEGDGGRHYFDTSRLRAYARPVYPHLLALWDGGPVTVAGTVAEGEDVSGFRVVAHPGPRAGHDRAVPRARRRRAQLGLLLHARHPDGPPRARRACRTTRSTSTRSRHAPRSASWRRSGPAPRGRATPSRSRATSRRSWSGRPMGRRSRRRGEAEALAAPESAYTAPSGDVLVLRGSMTPATRREYAGVVGGSPLSREDAWQRAVEFLFERLAVRWEIAGTEPIVRQKELLGRFRFATQDERRWIRDVLREHLAEHFPDVDAP